MELDQNYQQQRDEYHRALKEISIEKNEDDFQKTSQIRQKYHSLIKDLYLNRKNLQSAGSVDISSFIDTANRTFEQITKPCDALVDSKFLIIASDICTQKIKAASSSFCKFSKDDFTGLLLGIKTRTSLQHLVRFWKGFFGCMSYGDHFNKLISSFSTPRVLKMRQKKVYNDCKSQLITIAANNSPFNREIPDSVDIIVKIYSALCEHEKIAFFKFAIDPHSFSRTVENIFHISFLVKDSKAVLFYKDQNELYLSGLYERYKEKKIKHQLVHISMSLWEEYSKKYSINQALICSHNH